MDPENKKEWLQRPPEDHAQRLARLEDARARMDAHFRMVRPDALYERPIHERHRIVFYLGHVDAFDWNLLGTDALGLSPRDPELDQLFAFGIDPMETAALPSDKPSDWPTVDRVLAYVRRARERLDEALRTVRARDVLGDGVRMNVAIEHRLMHAETFAYMLHRLELDHKLTDARALSSGARMAASPYAFDLEKRVVEIPRGIATLGLARGSGHFGWDNEFEEHAVDVAGFRIDAFPITNRRYLELVRAGGYQARELWSEAGWAWRESIGLRHPVRWRWAGREWRYQGQLAETSLPLDAPVYVSHAEASAYARWRGVRLPTEAEWHRAAYGTHHGVERPYPWGASPPTPAHGCFDFASWDPVAVDAHPDGASAFGVHDLLGNGWEWTSTELAPFDGFEPQSFYRGYSADFFDGKHYVMKGGSPRTARCLLRRSFRNWFQAHYPYVYSTFRCVEG